MPSALIERQNVNATRRLVVPAAVVAFAGIGAAAEEQVLAFAAAEPIALAKTGIPGDDVLLARKAVVQTAVGAEPRIGRIGRIKEAGASRAAPPAPLAVSLLDGKGIIGAEMVHMSAAGAAQPRGLVVGAKQAAAAESAFGSFGS